MTTVYIQGKGKYKSAIKKALYHSDLNEGDHYIEGVNTFHETALYWKTGRITLKNFKEAIGANTVWKHRLKFFENVEDLVLKNEDITFTDKDIELINKYR
jgi:hypothetical protein